MIKILFIVSSLLHSFHFNTVYCRFSEFQLYCSDYINEKLINQTRCVSCHLKKNFIEKVILEVGGDGTTDRLVLEKNITDNVFKKNYNIGSTEVSYCHC